MRTTLTVDSDQRRRSAKERSFSVAPSNCGFLPGVEIDKLTRYADQLEADDFVAESRSDSHRHSHR